MSQADQREKSKERRIENLRARIQAVGWHQPESREVLGLLKGILDLLADEL